MGEVAFTYVARLVAAAAVSTPMTQVHVLGKIASAFATSGVIAATVCGLAKFAFSRKSGTSSTRTRLRVVAFDRAPNVLFENPPVPTPKSCGATTTLATPAGEGRCAK